MLSFQDIERDRKKKLVSVARMCLGKNGDFILQWDTMSSEYNRVIFKNIHFRKNIYLNLGNDIKTEVSKYIIRETVPLLMTNIQNDKPRWESDMFTSSMIYCLAKRFSTECKDIYNSSR